MAVINYQLLLCITNEASSTCLRPKVVELFFSETVPLSVATEALFVKCGLPIGKLPARIIFIKLVGSSYHFALASGAPQAISYSSNFLEMVKRIQGFTLEACFLAHVDI